LIDHLSDSGLDLMILGDMPGCRPQVTTRLL